MIHRLGTGDSHLKKKKDYLHFQMQCCYTGTEGMSPLTNMKFRQIGAAERKGFAAEQNQPFFINQS